MANRTFDEIIEVVLKHEGGYVDDPDDKGGATNFGVTQASYSQFSSPSPFVLQAQSTAMDVTRRKSEKR